MLGRNPLRRPGSPLTERAVNFIVKEAPPHRSTDCGTRTHPTPSTTAHRLPSYDSRQSDLGDVRARGIAIDVYRLSDDDCRAFSDCCSAFFSFVGECYA